MAKKIHKIEKTLALRRPETKHQDGQMSAILPRNDGTAAVSILRSVAQGLSDNTNRIGDKITLKRFTFRSVVYSAAPVTDEPLRMIVFSYKYNPDQVTSTPSAVVNLFLTSALMSGTNAPYTFQDWDNHGAFKVHYDKTRIMKVQHHPPAGDAAVSRWKWYFNIDFPPGSREVDWLNGSTTVICKNEFFILWLSANNGTLGVDGAYRLTYLDV